MYYSRGPRPAGAEPDGEEEAKDICDSDGDSVDPAALNLLAYWFGSALSTLVTVLESLIFFFALPTPHSVENGEDEDDEDKEKEEDNHNGHHALVSTRDRDDKLLNHVTVAKGTDSAAQDATCSLYFPLLRDAVVRAAIISSTADESRYIARNHNGKQHRQPTKRSGSLSCTCADHAQHTHPCLLITLPCHRCVGYLFCWLMQTVRVSHIRASTQVQVQAQAQAPRYTTYYRLNQSRDLTALSSPPPSMIVFRYCENCCT